MTTFAPGSSSRAALAGGTTLALAILLAPAARAAEADDAPVGEVLMEEIVVKSRRETRAESLEAREVRERGARDLGEALSAVPGLDKVRKGGIANDLVLRGMKKDDVAVTIDGARVHGACPARMDPPAFHLDYAEVDLVEVKRGPFDVSRPGGLAGAIDVRTRRGRAGLGTEVSVAGGSFGMLETSLTATVGREQVDLLVGGSFKQGSPFLDGDGRNVTLAIPAEVAGAPNPARFRDTSDGQTAYEVRTGFARLGLRPAAGQRLELGYTRQSAPRVLYPYLRMDGIADDTDRATARWTAGRLGPLSAVSAEAYYTAVAHDMTDVWRCSGAASAGTCTGDLPRDYSMGTFARSAVWGGRAEGRVGDLADGMAWKLGADFSHRTWDNRTDRVMRAAPGQPYASERSIPDVSITALGLYLEGQREVARATRVTAALRGDLARTDAGVDRTDLYQVFHAGRDLALARTDALLGGNLQLERDLGDQATAWAGYGHGARLPDPQERYIALSGMGGKPDWLGDPGLAPVQSDEVDLGLKWTGPGILLKAQAFHAWYAGYITLVDLEVTTAAGTRQGRSYANVAARAFGGEATARLALPARLWLSAALSYTRGLNDSAGTSLPEIPPLKGAAGLRWDDGRFFVEAEEVFAARQGFVDATLQEQPTDAWWITNLKAGAAWRGLKLFASVTNLLDRLYREHLSYQRDPFAAGFEVPEPGRSFQLTAQYAY
jgi:iron complex outermembrane receptor protein